MNTLSVPANLDSLAPIADFVIAAAERAGLNRNVAYNLRLAVEEFATNIVIHGYAGMQLGTIDLRAEMDERTLTIVIEDTAAPFDPRQVPPPPDLHLPAERRRTGGLGIHLALHGVHRYEYERVAGRNRSVLVVDRQRAIIDETPS